MAEKKGNYSKPDATGVGWSIYFPSSCKGGHFEPAPYLTKKYYSIVELFLRLPTNPIVRNFYSLLYYFA